jgi:hypothetical protein
MTLVTVARNLDSMHCQGMNRFYSINGSTEQTTPSANKQENQPISVVG